MPDLVALLFGALIIVAFSYERFNRATYEGGRQLERLVTLLSPDKLRARRIVLRAYVFYAITLLIIYFFLCAYAEVIPLLGGPDLDAGALGASKLPTIQVEGAAPLTTGFDPGGEAGESGWKQPLSSADAEEDDGFGIDGSVSLAIALIIVGLAPTFPVLRRFEDWMRIAAHRLAGIPTRVIGAAEELRHSDLSITVGVGGAVPADTILIPRGDWERMARYQTEAEDHLTAPDDFRRDLEVIFAASAWLLDGKLKLANTGGRERLDQLEAELRKRRDALIVDLDEKSGYRPGETRPVEAVAEAAPQDADKAEASEFKRTSWERLAGNADDLADDLCILLALYVEHEMVVAGNPVSMAAGGPRAPARQQLLARKKLEGFLGDVLDQSATVGHLQVLHVWLWTLGVVVVVALLWSLFPGPFETEMQLGKAENAYLRALSYAATALNSYCIPMLVALALHDGALHAQRWQNVWQSRWTVWLPQAAFLVFLGWLVATLFVVALALWLSAIADGGFAANERVWEKLQHTFEFNAPTTLRGAVLAVIVVFLIDASSGRASRVLRNATFLNSLAWATSAAGIMAFCGAITRALSSWSSMVNAGRPGFDEIDRGLIVYAALYSAIIGFFVVFCVAEALRDYRRSTSRGRATSPREPGQAAGLAPAE